MSPEQSKYFIKFESEHTPIITWPEMFERQLVIAPDPLAETLEAANNLLITADGPNLERRKEIVPPWFDYWRNLLMDVRKQGNEDGFVSSGDRLLPFENVKKLLDLDSWRNLTSGGLFVAAAEGHGGHIHAAKYMRDEVDIVVWGFEQDSHLEQKERGGRFLSLEVVLSMWFYTNYIKILTVLPEISEGVGVNDHYNSLFDRLGIDVMFYDETDPYAGLKAKRKSKKILSLARQRSVDDLLNYVEGEDEMERGVLGLAPNVELSAAEEIRQIISHLNVPPTSDRVKKLIPDIDIKEDLQLPWDQIHIAHSEIGIRESIFVA